MEQAKNLPQEIPRERRSKVVLYPELQTHFFSSITLSVLFIMGAFIFILVITGHKAYLSNWIVITAILLMFALAPLYGIHSILHSHRIAGPIYHLEKGMKRWAIEDFSYRIQLRNKDYFKNLALLYNQIGENLEKKEEWIQELQNQLVQYRSTLSDSEKKEFDKYFSKFLPE